MENKKAILKKYVGKGGLGAPSPFKMISDGIKGAKNKMQTGITSGITRFVGNTPAGNLLKAGLAAQKKGVMQKAIKTSMPLNAVKRMPQPVMKPKQAPKGWDSVTYQNFKKANPKLEPNAEDTMRMKSAR